MAAILGSMLNSFPELKSAFVSFQQVPLVNGGYGPRFNVCQRSGVFIEPNKRVKDSNGNYVKSNTTTLWVMDPIPDGYFIERFGKIYRLIPATNWEHQVGVVVYQVELRVGNSNPNEVTVNWNQGSGLFA